MIEPLRRALAAGAAHLVVLAKRGTALAAPASEKLRGVDLPGAIVTGLDRTEKAATTIWRVAQRIARSGITRLGAGLVWRAGAAAAGIALATALVSGLSSDQGHADAKGTADEAEPAQTAAIRDVRRSPLLSPASSDDWVAVNRPIAMFSLAVPEMERNAYEVRRSADGTRRDDLLSFGPFEADRPHLRIRLSTGPEAGTRGPLVVAIAREAATAGFSVRRSSASVALASRFGTVETTDTMIEDGRSGRACVGFRRPAGEDGFGFTGWWCGSADRPADRRQLACLIDRIDLAAAGEEPALRTLFARSEMNRPEHCTRPHLAAAGRRFSWLDAEAKAPPLRLTPPARPERAKIDRQRGKQKL